jgi:hypothetical protein
MPREAASLSDRNNRGLGTPLYAHSDAGDGSSNESAIRVSVARPILAATRNWTTMFRTIVVALAAMVAFDLLVLDGAYLRTLSGMLLH